MSKKIMSLTLVSLFFLVGCDFNMSDDMFWKDGLTGDYAGESGESGEGEGDDGDNQQQGNQPGVITAGEWNDLDSWSFWQDLIVKDTYKTMPEYWSFFNNNRISVELTDSEDQAIVNAVLDLKRNNKTIFSARTDNFGKAELWVDLYQLNESVDFSTLEIDINEGQATISTVKPYNEGVNKAVIAASAPQNKIEIAFVVDATGSMGDELEYLKTELIDVLSSAKTANPDATFLTSAVFYRDEGDDYVTRVSNFTKDVNVTVNFIKKQKAAGGGDYPEAVHTALEKAVNDLQWSTNAKTRLLFLVLDAPPHHKKNVISSLQKSINKIAEKGIKIIPITASGIDKETEFLMRFFSITTNGTYVFITNHSGIGNDHIEASVGEYQVEFLNDLMVRLINKYSK